MKCVRVLATIALELAIGPRSLGQEKSVCRGGPEMIELMHSLNEAVWAAERDNPGTP
jgi:hypothetical protein